MLSVLSPKQANTTHRAPGISSEAYFGSGNGFMDACICSKLPSCTFLMYAVICVSVTLSYVKNMGWRDGSVRITYCSYRRLEFGSGYPYLTAHNFISAGLSQHGTHVCIHIHINTLN